MYLHLKLFFLKTMLPTPVSIEVPPNSKITVEIKNFFMKLIDSKVVLCIVSNKIFEHLF